MEFGYVIIQDDDVEQYLLPVYIGSHVIRKNLLIDTLANGTIIDYDPEKSRNSVVHYSDV